MSIIGPFEAKTRFSEICKRVAAKAEAIVVARRGKPRVKIAPVLEQGSKHSSVWDRRAKYEKRHGRVTEDFPLPIREKQVWHNPLGS